MGSRAPCFATQAEGAETTAGLECEMEQMLFVDFFFLRV